MPPKPKNRPPLLARRTKREPMRHAKKKTTKPRTQSEAQSPAVVQISSALDFARHAIRDIPDFPKPGIMFKDITPLLASPRAFHIVLDSLAERFIGEHIDVDVGVEARGFVFGGALAARLNASFVPARKPGKLPAAHDTVQYDTEYSTAELQMHKDSIPEESRCIVVDDLLATGGTAKAAAELVRLQGGYVVAFAFVIELGFLNGREKLLPVRVETVLKY